MTSINKVTSIKLSYNNELRRFPFPVDTSAGDDDQFLALARTIAKSVGIPRLAFVLQYVDEEGDTITVSSQLELAAALAAASSPILRLSLVVRVTSVEAPTATTVTAPTATGPSPCHRGIGGKWRNEHGCGQKRLARFAQQREQFRSQLAELEREGLIDPSAINANGFGGGVFWAVHLLSKLNGDLEATKSHMRSRKDKMRDLKTKYATQLAELERAGFLPIGDEPVDQHRGPKGRCMMRKAIGLLERFDGDVQQVTAHIEKKRSKHLAWRQQPQGAAIPADRYAAELAELKERGFMCEGVCLRLLIKFDGDVEKVAERMATFRQARFGAKTHQHQYQCQGHQYRRHHQMQQAVPSAGSDHEAQVSQLMAKGIPRPKCERLLRKFDGDLARIELVLENRRKWIADASASGECRRKHHGIKEAKKQFASEFAQLKDMGFRGKWAIVPLLKQHNGDVQAVALALSTSA